MVNEYHGEKTLSVNVRTSQPYDPATKQPTNHPAGQPASQTKPNQTRPNQTKPNQTKPTNRPTNQPACQTKPNQTKPNRTPNQTSKTTVCFAESKHLSQKHAQSSVHAKCLDGLQSSTQPAMCSLHQFATLVVLLLKHREPPPKISIHPSEWWALKQHRPRMQNVEKYHPASSAHPSGSCSLERLGKEVEGHAQRSFPFQGACDGH